VELYVALILIVEDDEPLRSSLSRSLRAEGFDVQTAADGAEALRRVEEQPPDLVITDIIMAGRDGVELITALHNIRPQTPVLAMTGRRFFGKLDILDLARKIGAASALLKPFSVDEMLTEISAILRASEQGAPQMCRTGE
jgi:DNA-binding response OmpR family regulator